MTSARYTTVEGDVLDAILWRVYRREDQIIAALAANPGLCDLPPVLPAGLEITLPQVKVTPPAAAPVRLWD